MIKPLVSVIIVDYKKSNPYLKEGLDAIAKQTYKNYEIILITDYPVGLVSPKLRKKSYGKYVGPAKKRDDGAKMARGSILAFLDDDAFPDINWLKEMVKEYKDKEIVAVGGPGVTPPGVSWQEDASGWASASPLGSGTFSYRFLPGKRQLVDDYPSMNLSVRRKEFLSIGGFDSNYWPGEDTKLCLDLISKLNKKIIYNPKMLVYHHRRPVFRKHLIQNGNFGLHRGFFARILPKTSLKPIYFLPSLLLLGVSYLIAGYILSIIGRQEYVNLPFYLPILYLTYLYLFLLFANSIWISKYTKGKKTFQALFSIIVIFVTHLWYGLKFLQGLLFTDKLTR